MSDHDAIAPRWKREEWAGDPQYRPRDDSATLELVTDADFMERFARGVQQAERGEVFSFEDVFGYPL